MGRLDCSTCSTSSAPQTLEFDAIQDRPGLAGPDPLVVVRRVKKPETINYRTFKPERDGLFCAAIFGPDQGLRVPVRQVQAHEAPRRRARSAASRSPWPKVRRERMGHIELAAPDRAHLVPEVAALAHRPDARHDPARHRAHPLFRSYVVIEPGLTDAGARPAADREQYLQAMEEHGDEFDAGWAPRDPSRCC